MWTRINSHSLVKKGKSLPSTPYFTITSGTATRTLTPDGSYNVYLFPGSNTASVTATAKIFNMQNITLQCLLIGQGGYTANQTGTYGSAPYASGGGGGGAFLEYTYTLTGSTSEKTITFTFTNNSTTRLAINGTTIYTAGNGGNGSYSGGGSGSNGASGGGGGAYAASTSTYAAGTGSLPGFSGGIGGGYSAGNNYGGGGGGAGGAGTPGGNGGGNGGPGKATTLPGISQIYGSTLYCAGGSAAWVGKAGTSASGGDGTSSSTYGSGAAGQHATSSSFSGQPGAIMIAIHVNDIPSPTP
jgi:hypothetical protein